MSQEHLSDLEFSELDLIAALQSGIEACGFQHCTPIQAQTLPIALGGKDVAGQAQTGTGKTAAFLIALFQRLLANVPEPDAPRRPRALILAPTRELAIQIAKDAEALGRDSGLKIALAYGGTDYDKQRDNIAAGVDVLIGTPGRLIDYFKQKVFSLRAIEVLVLDEADRMFDLGFIKDIRYLLRRLPEPQDRLNLLFSATLSHRVLELAYEHMNDPELIRVEPDKVTADRVKQRIFFPANEEKLPLLVRMLREESGGRSMVFVNTKREAEQVEATLQANDIQAQAISGDVRQKKRQRMLLDFQEGKLHVLIATDVASRGLHIPDVTHVYNYDLPQDREDYVHRIGRTARAGASGEAISFGCERYAMSLPDIEDYIGHKIPVDSFAASDLPTIEIGKPAPRRRPRSGPGNGAKPSGGGDGGKPRRRRRRRSGQSDNRPPSN
ncbi:MAG: ATP-dependent RNA helicase RhlB [Pseudomonadota bacterium]